MDKLLIHIDATAGWGKTTAIERDVKKYAELCTFWRTDKALYLVFTRRNAYDAVRRLRGYVSPDNIRTLHSYCYSFMKRKPVMDGKLLQDFSKEHGYGFFSSGMFFTPRSREDYLLAFYYRMRNTRTDVETAIKIWGRDFFEMGISEEDIYRFIARWESFKKRNSAIDYADILEYSNPSFEGIYLALDEAQDCTPLMWYAFEKIIAGSPSLKRIVIVGDCDQNIYEFQGSDPQMFLLFPEVLAKRHGFEYVKWNTRNISRRVPSKPLSFALKFLDKVKYRDHGKEILPAREGGEVLFMTREEFLDFIKYEMRKVVIQERHRHELLWWKEKLEWMSVPYIESTEDLRRFKAWEGLIKKETMSYIHLWNLFKNYLPPYEIFLRKKDEYLHNFHSDKEKWIRMLDKKTKLYAINYPRVPVFLTTMHSQKGEEGDVVWVSGRWTKKVKVSDEERKLYFTACTRTRDVLVIDKEGWFNIRKLL